MSKLIFELSKEGRSAVSLPASDVPFVGIDQVIPAKFLRKSPPELPQVGELTLVRHYLELAHKNMSIDSNFYPLGSCTMKYNPKINEKCAAMDNFAKVHPLLPEEKCQGLLQLMYELSEDLKNISGMDAISIQPAAGAQGELTGLLMIKSYLKDDSRDEVLIPDSAHGTNPASCTMVGFKTVQVKTNSKGNVDLDDLSKKISNKTACMMITNPNTLGLFEEEIMTIQKMLHAQGALLYMDGANMNALLGFARPGDFGVDVMHINLHKTFSTPHGGGGPGSGPVACKKHLEPYLPFPRIVREGEKYKLNYDCPNSVGRVHTFFGNVGMHVRAFVYIRCLGNSGLRHVTKNAVLNANYLLHRLKDHYKPAYRRRCMHECVLSGLELAKTTHVKTLDVAKRLLDYKFHPPTIYFPQIVPEAIMIEPTETETKETLDAFADAMIKIAQEAKENPQLVHDAPYTTPVSRLDEVKAARQPVLRYNFNTQS